MTGAMVKELTFGKKHFKWRSSGGVVINSVVGGSVEVVVDVFVAVVVAFVVVEPDVVAFAVPVVAVAVEVVWFSAGAVLVVPFPVGVVPLPFRVVVPLAVEVVPFEAVVETVVAVVCPEISGRRTKNKIPKTKKRRSLIFPSLSLPNWARARTLSGFFAFFEVTCLIEIRLRDKNVGRLRFARPPLSLLRGWLRGRC